MEDSHFHYEYQNETFLHPLAAVAIVLMGVTMLLVPRRYAVIPMIVIACFISSAQRVTILSLDFNLLRDMVAFGWLRVLGRSEGRGLRWKTLDTLIVAWALSKTVAYTLLHGDFAALVYQLGSSFDAAGMYFLFRCLVRNWQDFRTATLGFMVVSLPVAAAFLVEWHTAHNLFAILGGVWPITIEREGRLRCQGAFAHPILAGCFWASLLPLFAGQFWRGGKDRMWAIASFCAAMIVVVACASSTPIAAVGLGFIGAGFVVFRRRMRWIRWGLLGTVVGLHLVMKAPSGT